MTEIENDVMIEFRVEFEYNPEYEQGYEAHVSVILPVDETRLLVPEFRSYWDMVCGESLGPRWGMSCDGGRISSTMVTGDSWGEVMERIEKLKAESLSTLRSVYNRNKVSRKTMPSPYKQQVYLFGSDGNGY